MRRKLSTHWATAAAFAALSGFSGLMQAPALAHDGPTPAPSRFGAGDQIGAANYLSPELALQASRLVRSGKTYSLAIPTTPDTPALAPRSFRMTVVQPGQVGGATLGPSKSSYNDDILAAWVAVGTQIDGLGHVGIDNVYYNGNKASDFVTATGLTRLGIEGIPPFVTRGVVLDMAGYFGSERLKEGQAFNRADMQAAARRQGVQLRRGDVVLLHTGWLGLIGQDNARFLAGEPGLGLDGARYLTELGVVAVGADNWAVEVLPNEKGNEAFDIHQHLLARSGTYILEYVRTDELVRDQAWEFMFVLGTPRYAGGVQAVVNPVAIR